MLGLTLDLSLKLIDRCIALVKHREESNKNLYRDFVAPAVADFEAVHKNYMESFRQYGDMIANSNTVLNEKHSVIKTITRDSLFSHDLRAKVYALRDLIADPLVGKFVKAIYEYMDWASDPGLDFGATMYLHGDSPSNPKRYELREGLEKVFSKEWTGQDEKRLHGLRVVDEIVFLTQEKYSAVVGEHTALKRRLLQPK